MIEGSRNENKIERGGEDREQDRDIKYIVKLQKREQKNGERTPPVNARQCSFKDMEDVVSNKIKTHYQIITPLY